MQFSVTKFLILKKLDIISFACPVLKHTCTSTYTVEATYKGRLYQGTAAYKGTL